VFVTVKACILQSFATIFILIFAATKLDLPLGPLSSLPGKLGVILGVVGLLCSFGAIGININNNINNQGIFIVAQMLGGSTTSLSVMQVLSYVWIMLTSQSAFSTIMGFSSKSKMDRPELVSRLASPLLGNELPLATCSAATT
jgi:hypothetical protein